MSEPEERNLGIQPIGAVLDELGLKPHDLVAASHEQLTHKMVTKACNGRRLTTNVQFKVLRALSRASDKTYAMSDLFNY